MEKVLQLFLIEGLSVSVWLQHGSGRSGSVPVDSWFSLVHFDSTIGLLFALSYLSDMRHKDLVRASDRLGRVLVQATAIARVDGGQLLLLVPCRSVRILGRA